jgi:hypothetical protein
MHHASSVQAANTKAGVLALLKMIVLSEQRMSHMTSQHARNGTASPDLCNACNPAAYHSVVNQPNCI